MPLKCLDEAFVTAVHLINHLPSCVIDQETPFQCHFSSDPDYAALGSLVAPASLISAHIIPRN
jgi:hypothetical protein